MAGRVFYFDEFSNGCTKSPNIILDPEGDPDNDFSPIVLVDRGNCSFVRKARNVQELGGALTLIVDSRDDSDPTSVIMIDDGTGANIAIPTVMISKEDGARIKSAIKRTEENNKRQGVRKEFVVMIVDFEINKPDDRVEYDIWYTSGDSKAMDFIRNMHKYNKRLGKNAQVTPHMMVQTCLWCSTSEIERNCISTSGAVYCAPPVRTSNLQGNEALRQGLQEYCVYDIYKDSTNSDDLEKWWKYMDEVYPCQATRYSSSCTGKALNEAQIDTNRLQTCLLREADILNNEHKLMQYSGIQYNPAIVINQHVYRGALDAENVFKSICAGFNVTPAVCYEDYDPEQGKRKETSSGGIGTWTIIGLIIMLIVINGLLIYCYRRYTRREMKDEMQLQISSMISQYFALTDNNKSRPATDAH